MRSKIFRKQIAALFILGVSAFTAGQSHGAPAQQEATSSGTPLDFDFFKARVEPIFLERREGHARCYACHALGKGGGPKYLVKLSPGSTFWTEEQSRENFKRVSILVNRDDPMDSRLLIHPLSPVAGGDMELVHGGGRQFESKDDPDWKILAAWVSGQK